VKTLHSPRVRAVGMNAIVTEELRAIPRGDFAQNELRMIFNIQRRYDLARDVAMPAWVSFERALTSVRQRHAAFVPKYDAARFGQGNS
jgi:hypothetical protein